MIPHPRPYTGQTDLHRMMRLLSAGQRALPRYYYVHPGDLNWWVYYNPSDIPVTEKATLWEDDNGELVAWIYASPEWSDFDYFVAPAYRATDTESAILDWAEKTLQAYGYKHDEGKNKHRRIATFAVEGENDRIALLSARGYQPEPFLTAFTRSINPNVARPTLPEGYTFLDTMSEQWVEQRADVHRSAFVNSRMTADYYRQFMRAPLYDPALDTVIVGPDGRLAAFAMVWVDDTTGIGSFEPVGTRAEWQRRGLGRAAMQEGLRRMAIRGMHTAQVLTHSDNASNLAFYQSCGFQITHQIRRFCKPLQT